MGRRVVTNPRSRRAHSPGEVPSPGEIFGQTDGDAPSRDRFGGTIRTVQPVGSGGPVGLISFERAGVEAVECDQRPRGAEGFAVGGGAFDPRPGGWFQLHQALVEQRDRRPIDAAECPPGIVGRLDRRFDLEAADNPRTRRRSQVPLGFADFARVPPRKILLALGYEVAGVGPSGGLPDVAVQHEREQPEHLGFTGHQLREQPSEADAFVGEARDTAARTIGIPAASEGGVDPFEQRTEPSEWMDAPEAYAAGVRGSLSSKGTSSTAKALKISP